ncbi:MAG TPA: glutathione synthase [Burkholderiales bacterium]|nr:glutathione synthase [Burkholderiales bacterium]
MKLAFILDPLDDIKTYKDSSYAMMQEAARRGHELFVLQQEDILCRNGAVSGRAAAIQLTGAKTDWYALEARREVPLAAFDALLMRKDPPFDMEYVYSTYLLELAEGQGARVINRPRALRDCNEKFSITRFVSLTVPTLVTRLESELRAFLEAQADVVLKPLDGMGGASIFRLQRQDPNIGVVIETLTHYGRRTIMAQRYIPDIVDGDKRILLIDGEPVPYALARIPKPGETRGNLAAGARGVVRELSARDREIARTVGPVLAREGMLLVGLDVIGDYLTEINVTSPTGMREIMDQSGFDVAGMMIDAVERRSKSD